MTSQPSNEDRNRLRLQAWEERNQESSQTKGRNSLNVHLFGQPYKTFNGDELSNRIQRMLGSYEDHTTTEPFTVPSSLTFPLSSFIHHISEPPFHQVCCNTQSQKGPCADPPTDTCNSPKLHCEEESQSIHAAQQKTSAAGVNHVNTQASCKDTSSPHHKAINMLHSQAFHPPLSHKQPKAATTQKPTAYVRPMDGLDLVASQSPGLKPSPERYTRPPDVGLEKPVQEEANLLPRFLENKPSGLECVEGILKEMTCSWPPLLSGIHSPRPEPPPKPPVLKEITPPKQEPSNSHQRSSVDVESFKSASESESDTEDPPVSSSLKSQPAPASGAPGDWQLEKLMQFRQQNYRSKSQWAQSSKLSPLTDGTKRPGVFSPARETPNVPFSTHNTVNLSTSQKSCSDTKERIEASDAVKRSEENQVSTEQEEEPKLHHGPNVKLDLRRHKQSKNVEMTSDHHKVKKVRNKFLAVGPDQCSTFYPDRASPACPCVKPKAARHKKSKLSEGDECTNRHSLDREDILSLVVKINLNLLSKIPRTSGFVQHCTKDNDLHKVTNGRKNDEEDQMCPKRKRNLQAQTPSLHTARLESSSPSKTIEKMSSTAQKSKKHKHCSDNLAQLKKEPMKGQNNPKKSSGKNMDKSTVQKPMRESSSHRPLLRFEDLHHPVKHYIKEAKRLKHKADAEMDKLRKTFHYLDAALFFIESGIAMEKDPQISTSSYTMFAETVELIKFVLKLSNMEDPSPTENDLIALCLRCQALLQMAMFHHKQKTALKYSKTLTDHFNNSSQSAPEKSFSKVKHTPKSPKTPCASAAIPQDIGQVALVYVNITTLVLNAHDLWEQADEFVRKGSGLSAELDKVMGLLSLTSTMSSMVRYIRQGLHWLQGPKVK